MKHLAAILILSLSSCSKYDGGEPSLVQQLEGQWQRADNPKRNYAFGADFVSVWDYQFGTTLNHQFYTFETVNESDIRLINYHTGDTSFWRVRVVDSVATISDFTNYPSFYFDLKRE